MNGLTEKSKSSAYAATFDLTQWWFHPFEIRGTCLFVWNLWKGGSSNFTAFCFLSFSVGHGSFKQLSVFFDLAIFIQKFSATLFGFGMSLLI